MKAILKNNQPPGDGLMLTALVRDWKKAYPDDVIRVEVGYAELFRNNPNIDEVKLKSGTLFNTKTANKCIANNGWQPIQVHYGDEPQLGIQVNNPYSIHKCSEHKKHFMYGMIGYINALLSKNITLSTLQPDIYLSEEEKQPPFPDVPGDYWVAVPGGKSDYTRKVWKREKWEKLFALLPEVRFVQIGGKEKDHFKPQFPDCNNVTDLTGQTTLRQVLSLIYNARGVICPITFAMHAAACFPGKPCIVLAGAAENWEWEAYPEHDYLHTCKTLDCCRGDGWGKCADNGGACCNLDETGEQKCMVPITAEVVADIVEGYR